MLKQNNGFTLIELMITLAVAAIVLGIAVPSFNSTILDSRSAALGSELTVAVNFARAEAVKRATRVSICPSSDGAACLTSGDWAKGWLVFTDNATSDAVATASIGTVLRHWSGFNSKSVVTAKNGSVALDFLRFTPNGSLARSNAADVNPREFVTYIDGCKGNSRGRLRVGVAGLINTQKIACQ
ncbi:MAG TPA: GspH/FimT family pseudopilin [Cellvibrio sp.]|nr:GspH/FimT family pseudopilin [Cellvibrio sp.]